MSDPAAISMTPSSPPTWKVWTSAPHRVLFLLGALQALAVMASWAVEVGARHAGLWAPVASAFPPAWGHGFLMVYGLFPWFIFGFAMTAMPNWTGRPIPRSRWLATALPMAAGMLAFHAGLYLGTGLAVAGLALYSGGWVVGASVLARLVLADRFRDAQATAIVVLLAVGAAGAALFGWAIATERAELVAAARDAGLWLFLLPLFLVVSHRMIPFFSSRIIAGYAMYRPRASFPFLAAACVAHFALETAGLTAWTWLADAPMAAWVGWLALRWGLAQSFRARLLAMLHLALVALAVSLALFGGASLAALAGRPGLLGLAGIHALAIGYFTAMTVAMVSRVSLGHSGRALEADRLTWACFLALLALAALRALAEVLPGAARGALVGVTALGWIALFALWGLRYVPIYLAPRADGRPG